MPSTGPSPEAAVEILSTEEAAAVVKLCYAHNIPVTTRGAGTGLVGGVLFWRLVLSTARMNRILI
ncbi:MAG: FAD-binding oxidoreductase [Evtepia gabavorous]